MKTNIDYLIKNDIKIPQHFIENKDNYEVNVDSVNDDTYIRIGLPDFPIDYEIFYKGVNPIENS